jgi:ABC-2 type transport system permease protein
MSSRLQRNQLVQLTLCRLREFGREPEALFWTFFFPVVMAIALGVAFRNKAPDKIFIGVQNGPGADLAVAGLAKSKDVVVKVFDEQSGREALRKGSVALVVVPGANGYAFRFDPTRPESRMARLETDDALQRASGRAEVRVITEEKVTDKGSRYIDFLIPGLIGLNLLSTGMWGVGFTIVRMRKEHLLKRLLATPMRKSAFLLSFIVARLAFLAIELAVLLGFAYLAFGVEIRGSIGAIAMLGLIGAVAFTGLGLLVASRSRTIEGVSGIMNLAQVPMWLLSGVFFSSDKFPAAMQPFIKALPLTAMVNSLRATMIDGASLAASASSIAIITAWGVVAFAGALGIFRWR